MGYGEVILNSVCLCVCYMCANAAALKALVRWLRGAVSCAVPLCRSRSRKCSVGSDDLEAVSVLAWMHLLVDGLLL